MCMYFDDLENEIRNYCKENNFSFEKAKKMSKCGGLDFLALQFYDQKQKSDGLRDETPLPLVLMIRKTSNGLVFEQTEYTRKYLTV